jgi:hypothetical protein
LLPKLKRPSLPKPKLLLPRPPKSPEKSTSPVKNVAVVVAVEVAVVNIEVDAVTTVRDVADTPVVPKPTMMVSWLPLTVPPLDNAVVANVADVEATTTAEVLKEAKVAITSEEEETEVAVEVVVNTPKPDLPPQTTNEEATGTTN